MRLREVQWILRSADEFLTVGSPRSRNVGGNVFQTVSNVIPLRQGLTALRTLKAFQSASDQVLQHVVFLTAGNEAEVSESERNGLAASVSSLRASVTTTLEIINQLLPEESPETFAYRLPTFHEPNVDAISLQIHTAKKIFEQPLKRIAATDLRVRGFESGSNVVEFLVGAAAVAGGVSLIAINAKPALNLVARIYAGAKDLLEFRQAQARRAEELTALKLSNVMLAQEARIAVASADAKIAQIARGICGMEECWAPGASDAENPHLIVGKSISLLAAEMQNGATLQFASNIPASIAAQALPETLAPQAARNPVAEPVAPAQLTASTVPDQQEGNE